LSLRVEGELARLFRSDFGRGSGGGGRGGARVGTISARVEEESAQLAAKAEEKIQSLIRSSQIKEKEWRGKIEALEASYKQTAKANAPREIAGAAREEVERSPAGENKDNAADRTDAEQPPEERIDVEDVINKFRARAIPRLHRCRIPVVFARLS
jgi:DNA-binding SARP family transcriptional activator